MDFFQIRLFCQQLNYHFSYLVLSQNFKYILPYFTFPISEWKNISLRLMFNNVVICWFKEFYNFSLDNQNINIFGRRCWELYKTRRGSRLKTSIVEMLKPINIILSLLEDITH